MSKIIIRWGLAAFLAVAPLSVLAQNESTASGDEPPPTGDAPPPDAAVPADDAAAPADASAESSPPPSDSGSSGEASADNSSSSEGEPSAGSDSEDGIKLYFGAERVEATLDLSDDDLKQRYGDDKLDGAFYRGRVGVRVAPGIAIEGHGGFLPDDDKASNDAKFKHLWAAYLVTTGTVLDTVELSGRVGWAWVGVKNPSADESFNSFSYGLEASLPLRVFAESLPDIRFVAAATVFSQERQERSYGWSYGLRYDFSL